MVAKFELLTHTKNSKIRGQMNLKSLQSPKFTLLAILCLLLALAIVQLPILKSEIEVTDFQLQDESQTHVYKFHSSKNSVQGVSAVLLHGIRCSAQMMFPLARSLAAQGIDTYAFNFPGHGDSEKPLDFVEADFSNNVIGVQIKKTWTEVGLPILKSLYTKENLWNQKTVLIGHSWGSFIAHDVLKSEQFPNRNVSWINLDGVFTSDVTLRVPTLGLFAEKSPHERHWTQEQFSFPVHHLGIIYDEDVTKKMIVWLSDLWGIRFPAYRSEFHFLILVTSTLLLVIIALLTQKLFVRSFAKLKLTQSSTVWLWLLGVGGVFPMGCFYFMWRPYSSIRVFAFSQSLYFIYLLGISLILFLAGAPKGLRKFLKFNWWQGLKEVSFGFLSFVILIFLVAPYVNHFYFHAGVYWIRWLKYIFFAVGLFPLCWILEKLTRSVGPWEALFRKAGFWIILSLPYLSFQLKDGIPLEFMELLAVFLFLEIIASYLFFLSRSVLLSATFLVLSLAWLPSMIYPWFQI